MLNFFPKSLCNFTVVRAFIPLIFNWQLNCKAKKICCSTVLSLGYGLLSSQTSPQRLGLVPAHHFIENCCLDCIIIIIIAVAIAASVAYVCTLFESPKSVQVVFSGLPSSFVLGTGSFFEARDHLGFSLDWMASNSLESACLPVPRVIDMGCYAWLSNNGSEDANSAFWACTNSSSWNEPSPSSYY